MTTLLLQKGLHAMDGWGERMSDSLDKSLTDVREKDLRFFRIGEFRRNIGRVDEFSIHCAGCRSLKDEIEPVMSHVNEAVSVPGEYRRGLDRVISRLSAHMMKVHRFYPPFHYTYLGSFIGMLSGCLIAVLTVQIIPGKPWELLYAGLIAGLLTGQFIGHAKDRKIRAGKRLM